MSSSFNPYREWLGIPGNGRPLNYYRLLGLTTFESNPATIERAAQNQLVRIQMAAGPEQAGMAQALAAEITTARNLLLSPASKAAYDHRLGTSGAEPMVVARPAEPMTVGGSFAPRPVAIISTQCDRRMPRQRIPVWSQPLVIISSVAALAIIGIIIALLRTVEERDNQPVGVAAAAPRTADAADRAEHYSAAPDEKANQPKSSGADPTATPRDETSIGISIERDAAPRASAQAPADPPTNESTTAQPAEPLAWNLPDRAPNSVASGTGANQEQAGSLVDVVAAQPDRPQLASAPKSAASEDWLKLNENGEPVEATLINGAVVALPTYGDGYDGDDWRPPVPADKAETVIDYQRLRIGGAAAGMLNVDAEHRKLYWMDGDFAGRVANIRSASLDGGGFRTIRNLHGAGGLKLDAARQQLYWVANDEDGGKVIQRMNIGLDGTETIVTGLKQPKVAIDSVRSKLYYFDEVNVVRCSLDGSNESRLLVTDHRGGTAVVDPRSGTVYWAGDGPGIDALVIGDTHPKEMVNLRIGRGLGHISSIAIDEKNGQLYWNNANYGSIRRANPDGSGIEDIVIGADGVDGVAIDSEHQFLYWMQNRPINGSGDVLIRRTPLPPPLVRTKRPAPPVLSSIEPATGAPGCILRLIGVRLDDPESVSFIDYAHATRSNAEILSSTSNEIIVRLPKLAARSTEVSIIVQGPGGVTFTLPRKSQEIKMVGAPEAPGFTRFDRFANGQRSFFLATGGALAQVEDALIYSEPGSNLSFGKGGGNTCFLKNGAIIVTKNGKENWIYHEPFALIYMRDRANASTRFIPVPAIRPSVIDRSFTFEPTKLKEEK